MLRARGDTVHAGRAEFCIAFQTYGARREHGELAPWISFASEGGYAVLHLVAEGLHAFVLGEGGC